MKNPKNNIHSNKILYESIYEELNEKEANKIRKKRIRDYTKIILQHCIQEGYIKSFQELKKGKSIELMKREPADSMEQYIEYGRRYQVINMLWLENENQLLMKNIVNGNEKTIQYWKGRK